LEHLHSTTDDRPVRIPRAVWIVGGGLLIALVAIVIFKVPFSTVAYFGFIALMMGSHLFMHGGHGGHGSHSQPNNPPANSIDTAADTAQPEDQATRHSGGCH
jgi:hypothetical protein